MPKPIKVKIDKKEEVPAPVVEVEIDLKVEEKPVAKKVEFPEGHAAGKFHAVEFGGGYVVYNPAGQRATGVINKIQADDIVRLSNQAAHIKG